MCSWLPERPDYSLHLFKAPSCGIVRGGEGGAHETDVGNAGDLKKANEMRSGAGGNRD